MSEKRRKFAIIVKGRSSFTRTLNQLFKRGFVFTSANRYRSSKDVFDKDPILRYQNWTNAIKIFINCDAECKMVLTTSRHIWADGRSCRVITLAEFLKNYEPNL